MAAYAKSAADVDQLLDEALPASAISSRRTLRFILKARKAQSKIARLLESYASKTAW